MYIFFFKILEANKGGQAQVQKWQRELHEDGVGLVNFFLDGG